MDKPWQAPDTPVSWHVTIPLNNIAANDAGFRLKATALRWLIDCVPKSTYCSFFSSQNSLCDIKSATVHYALEPNNCSGITRVRTHVEMSARSTDIIFRFVKHFNLEQHNIIFDAFIRLMFILYCFFSPVIVVCQPTATKGCTIEP